MLLGRVIAGITGASVTVINAYVADVTAPEGRAQAFGLLGATFGAGFILGPVLGGVLGNIDLRLPFACAAGLALLNAAYGYFVLPESITPETRGKALSRDLLNPLAPLRDLGRYPVVRSLAASFILSALALQVLFNTWVLFTERTLGWAPGRNGVALALVGIMSIVSQAGLIGPAIRLLGERGSIITGLLLSSVRFTMMGAARTGAAMYGSIVVGGLANIAEPAIQGLISRSVDAREQGRVQGALASLTSLAGVVGPLLATWVYASFNGGSQWHSPGAAFYMAALFSLAGAALAGVAMTRMPKVVQADVPDEVAGIEQLL